MDKDLNENVKLLLDVVRLVTKGKSDEVQVEYLLGPGCTDDVSKTLTLNPTKKMVLLGLDAKDSFLKKDKNLEVVFARPTVVYVQMPCELEILQRAFDQVIASTAEVSEADLAARQKELAHRRRVFTHSWVDYRRYETDSQDFLKAAQEIGLKGTVPEIVEYLRGQRIVSVGTTQGRLDGVFCDVEGTLLDRNGNMVEGVATRLQQFSTEGKTVRLWTGGDMNEVRAKLDRAHVSWSLHSKYDFEGFTVEVAIDDLPAEKLLSDYGIKAEQYLQVSRN